MLHLPCSGLRLSCSSLYWQSSTATDRRTWIAPSLKAEPSFVAFAANRDPGLEAIFDYLSGDASGEHRKVGPEPIPSRALNEAASNLEAKVDADLAPYVANRDFSGVVLIGAGTTS